MSSRSKSPSKGSKPRPFGDEMANEGEVTHIPLALLTMYGAVLAYSIVVSQITGGAWWLQVAFYFAGLAVFYVWHWMCHQSWSPMFEQHMEHHLRNNPVGRFYSSDEQNLRKYGRTDFGTFASALVILNPAQSSNMRHGFTHEGLLFVGNALILLAAAPFVQWGDLAGAFVMAGTMGVLGAGLHSSFHVRGFVLARYAWYRELRALHFLHHVGDQKANLAVLNLGLDKLMGSLALDDPLRHRKKTDGDATDDETIAISKKTLAKVMANGRAASFLLFADVGQVVSDDEYERLRAVYTGWPSVLSRIVVFVVAILAFLQLEPMLQVHSGQFADLGFALFAPIRAHVLENNWAPALCTASSLLSELSVWVLAAASLLGPTTKPLVAGIVAVALRVAVNVVNPNMPLPSTAVWQSSQSVQLLTAVASASTFVAARVVTAAVFFLMVAKFKWWSRPARVAIRVAAALNVAFQIAMTLATQTNYSGDVAFALALAFAASHAARHGARLLDHGLP